MFKLLEGRLDNTLYRLGFAASRAQARQLVIHKHISVNGQIVNIPSYTLTPGDKVALRERSKNLSVVQDAVAKRGKKFNWLVFDEKNMEGTFVEFPERDRKSTRLNSSH